MRAAITATEGWSSSQVNQESSWDLPPSPEPKEHPTQVAAWKLPGVNNGQWRDGGGGGGAVWPAGGTGVCLRSETEVSPDLPDVNAKVVTDTLYCDILLMILRGQKLMFREAFFLLGTIRFHFYVRLIHDFKAII